MTEGFGGFQIDAKEHDWPVFDNEFKEVGRSNDSKYKDIYWKCWAQCQKGQHVILSYDLVKDIHCPICEPDKRGHRRNIWNQPSGSCPASCEKLVGGA